MNKLIDNMFTNAFVEIERVCSNALTSGHHMPDNWKQLTIAEQFDHFLAHLGGIEHHQRTKHPSQRLRRPSHKSLLSRVNGSAITNRRREKCPERI